MTDAYELILFFLDWQDSKPLDHFIDMDNEQIALIFEKEYKKK